MRTSGEYLRERKRMVAEQLLNRGIKDQRVLDAMRAVPRHHFVMPELRAKAYEDRPLPIGEGQTISQPYIVAFMSEALRLQPEHTALEIGTGSGYQTAILCRLSKYVYSIERFSRLANQAGERISQLGYDNLDIHVGDGSQGLPDQASFDRIIVTAAVPRLPNMLCSQLSPTGGLMVLPIGDQAMQELTLITRHEAEFTRRSLLNCRFVPLIGRYGFASGAPDDVEARDG